MDWNWNWIGLGFLGVTIVVAFFLIRALFQVSKAVHNLDIFLNSLEKDISPLVRNLRETTESINHLLAQTQERSNQLEGLFQTFKESAQIFSMVKRIMRGGVASTLINLTGLAVGVKTAGQTIFGGKKKGGK